MSQAGYTLAEALAALVMIGLAVAGLVAGVDQLGRIQGKAGAEVAQAQAHMRLNTGLSRLLEGAGPFRSDDAKGLSGEADHFSFACGQNTCGGELTRKERITNLVLRGPDGSTRTVPIGTAGALNFAYDDEVGEELSWPPSDAVQPRTLRAISIVKPRLGGDPALATARVFAEQPAVCAYDAISRTCRPEATQ